MEHCAQELTVAKALKKIYRTRCNAGKLTERGRKFALLLLGLALLITPSITLSAPLNLTNVPLFLSNRVQPNIFFMLDDSGSMDWEYLKNDGDFVSLPTGVSDRYLNLAPAINTTSTPNWNGVYERLMLCAGFNVQAYDPNATYTPWYGKDYNGVNFRDADQMETGGFAQIRNNPWCPNGYAGNICGDASNNGTFDLTSTASLSVAYYKWTDANGNGTYENGECGLLQADGTPVAPTPAGVAWASLSASEKRNYANWYSYYRKREYIAKRAVSELIFTSRHRVGLGTLHNNNNVGRQIENIDDISVPLNTQAQADKSSLFNSLHRINSDSGTPLRAGLRNVGRYFEGAGQTALLGFNPSHNNTFDPDSPIFDAAHGGECQQNFTVMMTDGYWNGTSPSIGNTDGDGNTAFDGPPYADSASNTLADVSMSYYERDLAPSLADRVPVNAADTAAHQHMVTYTVAFGVTGTLDPNGAQPGETGFPGWPAPSSGSITTVDDTWHAAYNGRGLFLSAKNPRKLIDSLNDALDDINARLGSASAVTASTGTLTTNTRIFQARFDSGNWAGDVLSVRPDGIDPATGATVFVEALDWQSSSSNSAAVVLANQDWNSGRNVITHNGTVGVPFRWNDISVAQQTMLIDGDTDPSGALFTARGEDRLKYIRGDHSNELRQSGNFRDRIWSFEVAGTATAPNNYVLGDIVHSSPQYVGAPEFAYPDYLESVNYNSFRVKWQNRDAMIYVGANDGMLHGFDMATGEEKIAYVPQEAYGKLADLTKPNYTHHYFVDETPVVADVFYGSAWHTVLIGSLRGGGRGIFALDITDPSTFSESNAADMVLWDKTSQADADLGYTFGKPSVGRIGNNWYAVLGNGYNNTGSGTAMLYLIEIGTGNVTKIDTRVGSTGTPNGLSTPALIDFNGDNIVDYAYAGDLYGNLWKFDLTGNSPSTWKVVTRPGGGGGIPTPLYVSTQPGATSLTDITQRQAITTEPEIGRAFDGNDGFMVYFGTGRYLQQADIITNTPQPQTFYGIWDRIGSSGGTPETVSAANLVSQTATASTITMGTGADAHVEDIRLMSNNPIASFGSSGATNEYMGWRFDLPEAGERMVTDPALVTNGIFFVTLTPNLTLCEPGGSSWLMVLNPRTGGLSTTAGLDLDFDGEIERVGAPGSTQNVQGAKRGMIQGNPVNMDSGLGQNPQGDTVMNCSVYGKQIAIFNDTDGNIGSSGLPKSDDSFRQSWRQIQ